MKVLIACECSGRVREAFAAAGHDAWSCDLQDTEIPGNHIKGNVLDILADGWDAMVAHPECKYLCFSGECWMNRPGRLQKRFEAFEFFLQIWNAPIPKIAIENSHSVYLNTAFRRPDQTIHPYHFGDPYKKATCLWLKGFSPLRPTNILPIGHRYPAAWLEPPGKDQSKNRARTYPGIAAAMASQWGF